jgi:type I restriction enzyme, S subunit
MEIRPGYKQTEVGLIPAEWRVETIGQLIDEKFILSHLDGNHGEQYPRSHEFKSYGVPYVGANDFAGEEVNFVHYKFLTAERAKRFSPSMSLTGHAASD